MATVTSFEKSLMAITKYNKGNISAKGKLKQIIFNRDILLQPFLLFFVSIVSLFYCSTYHSNWDQNIEKMSDSHYFAIYVK